MSSAHRAVIGMGIVIMGIVTIGIGAITGTVLGTGGIVIAGTFGVMATGFASVADRLSFLDMEAPALRRGFSILGL